MTTTVFVNLTAHTCPGCQCVFGLNSETDVLARQDGRSFRCTNPRCEWSQQRYTDDENSRLKKSLAQAQRLSAENRAEADRLRRLAEERADALRKAEQRAARARKRAAAGVCPCCHRTVSQMARHMKTKHPAFVMESK